MRVIVEKDRATGIGLIRLVTHPDTQTDKQDHRGGGPGHGDRPNTSCDAPGHTDRQTGSSWRRTGPRG